MREPYTKLYCHLDWATWDRLPLITEEMEPRLYGAIRTKLHELRCQPVAMGGVEDHMHCLCRFNPVISIPYLVQQVKGSTSHLTSHEITPAQAFKWQGAYGAFTVSYDLVAQVKAYVLGQKQHHANQELWPEWETTFITEGESEEVGAAQPA